MASRPALVSLLAAAAIPLGCGAFDKFDVTIEDSAEIPPRAANTPFAAPFEGGLTGLDLSANKTFVNNKVKPSDVDAIFVKEVKLTESKPELEMLKSVVESVTLFIEAPGQERKQIATGTSFPGGGMASLTVDGTINIKPYAVGQNMTVAAEIRLKQMPAFAFRINISVILHVDINLLGT